MSTSAVINIRSGIIWLDTAALSNPLGGESHLNSCPDPFLFRDEGRGCRCHYEGWYMHYWWVAIEEGAADGGLWANRPHMAVTIEG